MVKSIFCAVSVAAVIVSTCIILGGYGLLLSLFVVGFVVSYKLEQEQTQEQTQESK